MLWVLAEKATPLCISHVWTCRKLMIQWIVKPMDGFVEKKVIFTFLTNWYASSEHCTQAPGELCGLDDCEVCLQHQTLLEVVTTDTCRYIITCLKGEERKGGREWAREEAVERRDGGQEDGVRSQVRERGLHCVCIKGGQRRVDTVDLTWPFANSNETQYLIGVA